MCILTYFIQSKFFFLFIGWEPTMWPANNCLQIMVCSCAMLSNFVWLQTILCTCVMETVLFSFLRSLLRKMADRFASREYSLKKQTRWSNHKTIIELGYCKISWFVIVLQINYLLATDKSWHFAQPHPIIILFLLCWFHNSNILVTIAPLIIVKITVASNQDICD